MENFSPYIRVAMDSYVDSSWVVPERVLWDYELLYVMEGRLSITVETQVYEGRPGDVFLFKPNQKHSIRAAGGERARQPHVHFDLYTLPDSQDVSVSFKSCKEMSGTELGWFRDDELSHAPLSFPSFFRPTDHLAVERTLFDLIREYETKPPFYGLRMKSCLLELLAMLMRDMTWGSLTKKEGHVDVLMDMRSYIDRNVNRNMKLDELSEHFHISKYYLIHLFKDLFQMTPMQYHQHVRMQRAKNMIRFSKTSLQDVADQLGYSNIHTFSRAFKLQEGMSPSQYRVKGIQE